MAALTHIATITAPSPLILLPIPSSGFTRFLDVGTTLGTLTTISVALVGVDRTGHFTVLDSALLFTTLGFSLSAWDAAPLGDSDTDWVVSALDDTGGGSAIYLQRVSAVGDTLVLGPLVTIPGPEFRQGMSACGLGPGGGTTTALVAYGGSPFAGDAPLTWAHVSLDTGVVTPVATLAFDAVCESHQTGDPPGGGFAAVAVRPLGASFLLGVGSYTPSSSGVAFTRMAAAGTPTEHQDFVYRLGSGIAVSPPLMVALGPSAIALGRQDFGASANAGYASPGAFSLDPATFESGEVVAPFDGSLYSSAVFDGTEIRNRRYDSTRAVARLFNTPLADLLAALSAPSWMVTPHVWAGLGFGSAELSSWLGCPPHAPASAEVLATRVVVDDGTITVSGDTGERVSVRTPRSPCTPFTTASAEFAGGRLRARP